MTNNEYNQLIEKKFESNFDKIITDEYFIKAVSKNISELIIQRESRPIPKPGYRYKNDWYDRMSKEDKLKPSFFLSHIVAVWIKKSLLSSQERHVIEFIW